MEDLIKFIVENHEKFEYDENGRITNLKECFIDYDKFKKCNGITFSSDKEYCLDTQPKKVHFEYEDFVEEIKKNGGYVRYLAGKMISIIYPNTKEIIVDDGYSKFNLSYEDFCYKFTRLDGTPFEKGVIDVR